MTSPMSFYVNFRDMIYGLSVASLIAFLMATHDEIFKEICSGISDSIYGYPLYRKRKQKDGRLPGY